MSAKMEKRPEEQDPAEQRMLPSLPEEEVCPEPDLDELLTAAGEFGRYQQLLFAAMLPFAVFFAHVLFVQMFVTATPQQHWCATPELAHLTPERRREVTIPRAADGSFERCLRFAVDWGTLLAAGDLQTPAPNTSTAPCHAGYEFLHDDIPYPTITSELEWVCDKGHYGTVAQVTFFAGSLAGGLVFGWLADRFGRIPVLVGSNMCGCVGGVASIWATDLLQFSACRFLVGLAYDNCFMMMYIIVLEYVGPRYRTRAANLSIAFFFGLGCISLPWISLAIGDWRRLLLATSLPMLLALLVPLCVPESARWLVLQGRVKEATSIVHRIASVNKRTLPPHLLASFKADCERSRSRGAPPGGGVRALLARAALRRALLALVVVYMSCALVFDALVRLSDAFGLDFFLTFTLTSATEIPSVTLLTLTLDRWGRRSLTCWPMVICAGLCIIGIFVPAGVARACLGVAARFFINMSYNAVIQWGAELLPTGARAGGSNLVHTCGYLATALSPFIVYLGVYVWWLPLLLVCVTASCGAAACALLAETLHQPLPHSFLDAERLAASAAPCCLRSRTTSHADREKPTDEENVKNGGG